jgi:hypothetical protein
MVYNTQNYWGSVLRLSSGILKTLLSCRHLRMETVTATLCYIFFLNSRTPVILVQSSLQYSIMEIIKNILCTSFQTQPFGNWILCPALGRTYSIDENRESKSLVCVHQRETEIRCRNVVSNERSMLDNDQNCHIRTNRYRHKPL